MTTRNARTQRSADDPAEEQLPFGAIGSRAAFIRFPQGGETYVGNKLIERIIAPGGEHFAPIRDTSVLFVDEIVIAPFGVICRRPKPKDGPTPGSFVIPWSRMAVVLPHLQDEITDDDAKKGGEKGD